MSGYETPPDLFAYLKGLERRLGALERTSLPVTSGAPSWTPARPGFALDPDVNPARLYVYVPGDQWRYVELT